MRIAPEKTCFLFECCPALEFADAGRWLSATNALYKLLQAFKGERIDDQVEVIFESARGEVNEVQEVRITAIC